MAWVTQYQLFLFDFDGLLVDTEKLHYRAYLHMCNQRGFQLNWDFHRYSQAAHFHASDLRDQIYAALPGLQDIEPNWQVLYEEKKAIFLELIENETVPLLPGVSDLLHILQRLDIKSCVVTNSSLSLIKRIRKQNPTLEMIPHWMTREDYQHPKPDPECYQIAIQKFSKPNECIIGFEDSPRGLQALLKTRAKPVLICPSDSVYLQKTLEQYPNILYYSSFLEMQK